MTAGCGHMGTGVVSGPHAQKDVVSGPNAQNWLQAAQDLFDGLQSSEWFRTGGVSRRRDTPV